MTGRAVSGSQATEVGSASVPEVSVHQRTTAFASLAARSALGVLVLVACYLSGEWLAGVLRLPVPGSVIGMVLLFIVLCVQPVRFSDRIVVPVAERFVGLIPFLLVPAAVGVVAQLADIARDAPALVTSVVGGWVVTLLVTAFAAKILLRRADRKN